MAHLLPVLRTRGVEETWNALPPEARVAWLERVASAGRTMLAWRVAVVADQVARGVNPGQFLDGTYDRELHGPFLQMPWAEFPHVAQVLALPALRQRRERRYQERLRTLRALERYLASDKAAAAGFAAIPETLRRYYAGWVSSPRSDKEQLRRRELTRLLAQTGHLEDVPATGLDGDGGG